jgi:hypothetical protein
MAKKPPAKPTTKRPLHTYPLPDAELRDLLTALTEMLTRMTTIARRFLQAAKAEGFGLTSPEAREAKHALRRLQRVIPKLEGMIEEYTKRVNE